MSFTIRLGNFLFRNAFFLYKPMYSAFKNKQDAFEIALLKEHIHEGDEVLDIGANIGFYAGLISRLVGETGRVHCFEPDSTNFKHLQKRCSNLDNVKLINKAAGARSETLRFYTSKELNVDHRTYEPEEYDTVTEVEALSMDDYTKELKRVDFIKMDIQGFEMQAMQGMQNVLERFPKVKILSEFWPYGLGKSGSSAGAYHKFLSEKGFTCYLLEKNSLKRLTAEEAERMEPLGQEHYFNILAIRENV